MSFSNREARLETLWARLNPEEQKAVEDFLDLELSSREKLAEMMDHEELNGSQRAYIRAYLDD